MRAVLQRVSLAQVAVAGEVVGEVPYGLCVLVGVGGDDRQEDVEWLVRKVVAARVFEDDQGKMNRSIRDVDGSLLAVSQFTLFGDLRKGNRPSFASAMNPERARELFDEFCSIARGTGVHVETGRFREHMHVTLTNVGPVTLLLDSKKTF